jgi:HlyD family secretion protein
MKIKTSVLMIAVPAGLAALALIVIIIGAIVPDKLVISGMVESNEIDIASKIPGRVDSIFIKEGDMVTREQILARLSSDEIDAKVEQARGAMNAAAAKLEMAQHGARVQEKEAMKNKYLAAEHQFELAEKTWNRIRQMYEDSVISAQEKDQVEFKYNAAKNELNAVSAQYQMVLEGVREEEVKAAGALYHQAENAYKEALAYQKETEIISPADGQITKVIVDQGEIAAAGYPLFMMFTPDDQWVVINVREDQMKHVKQGRRCRVKLPAIDDKSHTFEISNIAAMADFATWKATNQKGDFDLKTFEVKLTPVEQLTDLRPGMSAQVEF